MSLHLLGGTFKGRRLKSPKGPHIRPTTALLRKAVFDICKADIAGSRFLDLFAGTGAMGLEALSRGAEHATFIDRDREALHCLRENIATLKLQNRSTLIKGDSPQVLKKIKERFEIVYVDPPYGYSLGPLLKFFDTNHLLTDGGTLFIEEAFPPSEDLISFPLKTLILKSSRRYGRSSLHIYTPTT